MLPVHWQSRRGGQGYTVQCVCVYYDGDGAFRTLVGRTLEEIIDNLSFEHSAHNITNWNP